MARKSKGNSFKWFGYEGKEGEQVSSQGGCLLLLLLF